MRTILRLDGGEAGNLSFEDVVSIVGHLGSLLQSLSLRGSGTPLGHLAVQAMVDSVEDGVDGNAGLVGRFGTLLVDTSLDEDGVPVVGSLLVDSVGTADITLGGVTDEVDGGRRSDEAVLGVAPLTHQARGELKGRDLGLAKGVGVKLALATGEVAEGNLEHAAESTHAEADVLVGSRPDDVVVGEVEGRTLVEGLAPCAELATLGHGKVKHDLDVTSPVPRVGKDENSVDDNVGEVTLPRVLVLLGGQLPEGGGGAVVLDDVSGGDNVLEAVTLGDLTTLLTLATDNEDGAVGVSHLAHGSVAADELARLDVALQLAGEIAAALLFGLTATIGEENVRNLNAVLVLAVENLHGLESLGDGLSASHQDAVDVKGKDKRVGDVGLDGRGERRLEGSERSGGTARLKFGRGGDTRGVVHVLVAGHGGDAVVLVFG